MLKTLTTILLATTLASCTQPDANRSVSIDSLFHAEHTSAGYGTHGAKYNRNMQGKGVTVHFGDQDGVRYGVGLQEFTNSYGKDTQAIAPSVEYCSTGSYETWTCAGGLVAVNNGYSEAIVPALSIEAGKGRLSLGALTTGTEDGKAFALGFFGRVRVASW